MASPAAVSCLLTLHVGPRRLQIPARVVVRDDHAPRVDEEPELEHLPRRCDRGVHRPDVGDVGADDAVRRRGRRRGRPRGRSPSRSSAQRRAASAGVVHLPREVVALADELDAENGDGEHEALQPRHAERLRPVDDDVGERGQRRLGQTVTRRRVRGRVGVESVVGLPLGHVAALVSAAGVAAFVGRGRGVCGSSSWLSWYVDLCKRRKAGTPCRTGVPASRSELSVREVSRWGSG